MNFRRVLQVGIDDDNRLGAARVVEAGGERRLLAEIAAERDHRDFGARALQHRQQFRRAVRGAVIDIDDLPAQPDASHDGNEAALEFLDHLDFVVGGHDDG